MKQKHVLIAIALLLLSFNSLLAQKQPPFWNSIQDFKKKDSISFPKKDAILFIGSSSFTMWHDVQSWFPGHEIINRGFGGSELHQLNMYADDIIFPYQPRQIVIYCGENDTASPKVNADSVMSRFNNLFHTIRNKMPDVNIVFISMKPSPSRLEIMEELKKGNQLIRDFLKKEKNTSFIDVFPLMLDESGAPKSDIFLDDNLHMNAKGYAIWAKAIKPYLISSKSSSESTAE